MVKDTDLHLYMDQSPAKGELDSLLGLYGFKYIKEMEASKVEPLSFQWLWKLPQVSVTGFDLIFYTDVCKDDLNYGKYSSFVILSGNQASSSTDLAMVDVFSILLLRRYGGRVHNPQRIDKISTDILLSGHQIGAFSAK